MPVPGMTWARSICQRASRYAAMHPRSPLATKHPDASRYFVALAAWLGGTGSDRCHVLGHSLGALIAARFAAEQQKWMVGLTLASIARGTGGFRRLDCRFRSPAAKPTRSICLRQPRSRGRVPGGVDHVIPGAGHGSARRSRSSSTDYWQTSSRHTRQHRERHGCTPSDRLSHPAPRTHAFPSCSLLPGPPFRGRLATWPPQLPRFTATP